MAGLLKELCYVAPPPHHHHLTVAHPLTVNLLPAAQLRGREAPALQRECGGKGCVETQTIEGRWSGCRTKRAAGELVASCCEAVSAMQPLRDEQKVRGGGEVAGELFGT